MIKWKFKCLSCEYRFTAVEPAELFGKFGDKCWQCGSGNIEKKVVKNGF